MNLYTHFHILCYFFLQKQKKKTFWLTHPLSKNFSNITFSAVELKLCLFWSSNNNKKKETLFKFSLSLDRLCLSHSAYSTTLYRLSLEVSQNNLSSNSIFSHSYFFPFLQCSFSCFKGSFWQALQAMLVMQLIHLRKITYTVCVYV